MDARVIRPPRVGRLAVLLLAGLSAGPLLTAAPAGAQDAVLDEPLYADPDAPAETAEGLPRGVRTGEGRGAVLRTLDKTSGEVIDVEMEVGQTMAYGSLQVTLHDCRYPANNPAGDAFGLIQVVDARQTLELFAGWMVASSPALNALEHRRYDVWILRCITSDG